MLWIWSMTFFFYGRIFLDIYTDSTNFLAENLTKKKYMGWFFFWVWLSEFFFLEIQKLRRSQPKEKNRYHKKKDISFDIAFFCRIGHKTWLSCFSCFSRLLNMFSLFFLRILLVSNVLCPSLHSQKVMFFYFALPVIMHVLVSILI